MGKLEEFSITFESQQAVFEPGAILQGVVVVRLKEEMKMRNIRLVTFGKGKVHWKKKKGYGDERRTIHYRAEEIYMNSVDYLFGTESDDTSMHPSGHHTYPFEVQLPQSLPSSFEGEYGYVRYCCQATIDKPWKFDHEVKECFTVISPLDLNTEPAELQTPMENNEESKISCCCCISGKVTAKFTINKRAFVPGERIQLNAEIHNESNTEVDKTRVAIKQYADFYGENQNLFSSTKLKPKSVSRIVAEEKHKEIPENGSDVWNETMLVPSIPPSRLEGCNIIDMTYALKFYVPTNCGSDIKFTYPITIGTIPLRTSLPPQYGMPITQQPVPTGFGLSEPSGVPASAPPPAPDSGSATAPGMPFDPAAFPPPPSYAQCVFGEVDVKEEGDSEHLRGQKSWAPVYPYYNWDQHQNATFGVEENRL